MRNETQPPTGLARRSHRLSNRETEQRMLRAALTMVNRTGLTVSLEHLSFEDVIREAGVARSAVYRHWPHKDLFLSDLVKELAKAAIPDPTYDAAMIGLIKRVVAEREDWLASTDRRHGLVIELFRQAALLDFQILYGSAQWRTYLALHATFLSLSEGELRDQIQQTLAESQQHSIRRVAAAWRQIAELFGYQLRPELGTTFETVATLASASLRGLIIMALSMPELATHRTKARPFGAARTDEWSLAALAGGSIGTAFLEPDPTIAWDDQRLASVRDALNALAIPDP